MGLNSKGDVSFKLQVILEYLIPGSDDIITGGTDSIIAGAQVKGITSIRIPMKPGGSATDRENNLLIARSSELINAGFRLYLRGHGDWQSMTLGGRSAQVVARDVQSLTANQAVKEHCQVISITGCELALLKTTTNKNGSESTNSFAKTFHRLMGGSETMKSVPVFARTMTVSVVGPKMAAETATRKGLEHLVEGSKMTGGLDDNLQKAGVKRVYYWDGNQQMICDAKLAGLAMHGLAEFGDGYDGVAA